MSRLSSNTPLRSCAVRRKKYTNNSITKDPEWLTPSSCCEARVRPARRSSAAEEIGARACADHCLYYGMLTQVPSPCFFPPLLSLSFFLQALLLLPSFQPQSPLRLPSPSPFPATSGHSGWGTGVTVKPETGWPCWMLINRMIKDIAT